MRAAVALGGVLVAVLLTGCASAPRRGESTTADAALGSRIAASAQAQVGRPYRYGGAGPGAFDCSGLVHFAHAAHGIAVPRTTAEQFRAAQPVAPDALLPGDLLFFRFDANAVSHVAVFIGSGRFVHAPQTGRPVETRDIDDLGYRDRMIGAGRLR